MTILLTGGTGTLGRLLTPMLTDAGRRVRVLSRHPQEPAPGVEYVTGDLATGSGVSAAVAGVETIVHCAGSAKGDAEKARNLVRGAAGSTVRHLVYISVVGADRVPVSSGLDRAMFGYFEAKGAAEDIVAESGLPWTTLRATQFHELLFTTVSQLAKLPIVPVPVGRFQPIDGAEVATRLAELALGAPAGLVPEMGGPQVYELMDVVRDYVRRTNRHRLLLPMKAPGQAAKAVRAGATLTPGHAVGRRTWEDFLADRLEQERAHSH